MDLAWEYIGWNSIRLYRAEIDGYQITGWPDAEGDVHLHLPPKLKHLELPIRLSLRRRMRGSVDVEFLDEEPWSPPTRPTETP